MRSCYINPYGTAPQKYGVDFSPGGCIEFYECEKNTTWFSKLNRIIGTFNLTYCLDYYICSCWKLLFLFAVVDGFMLKISTSQVVCFNHFHMSTPQNSIIFNFRILLYHMFNCLIYFPNSIIFKLAWHVLYCVMRHKLCKQRNWTV